MKKNIIGRSNGKFKGRSTLCFNKETGHFTVMDAGIAYIDTGKEGKLREIVPQFDKKAYFDAIANMAKEGIAKQNFRSSLASDSTNVPANVKPSPENTLFQAFRLISATMVGGGSYKATDFTDVAVLRASLPLMLGKTVYSEHWSSTSNWLGTVAQVAWTESYAQGDIIVPAGIDGVLALNTTTERGEDIAKGVLTNAVISNSVGIEFEWEFSHPILDTEEPWELYQKIGKQAPDGRMYCRKVTKILNYSETSLVSEGADPFAKKLDSMGNLILIDKSGAALAQAAVDAMEAPARANFYKEVEQVRQTVESDSSTRKMLLSLSKKFFDAAPETEVVKSNLSILMEEKIQMLLTAQVYENKTAIVSAMADACECTPRTISNYLSGATKCPKTEMLKAMSGILQCTHTCMVDAATKDGCNYDNVPPVVPAETSALDKATNIPPIAPNPQDNSNEELTLDKAKLTIANMQKDILELKQSVASEKRLAELAVGKNATFETEKQNLQSDLNTTLAKLTQSVAELQKANADLAATKPYIEFAKEQMAELRKIALHNYNMQMGADAVQSMIGLIEKSEDITFLRDMIISNGSKAVGQFTSHCKDCKSTHISYGSVLEPDPMEVVAIPQPKDFPTTTFQRERGE